MENLDTKGGNMLDLKEEKQFEQLRRLGQKLHIPIPEHFITLEVFDRDGKLIQRHHQRSHSWVRNAYNCMFSQLAGKDCDGVGFGAGILTGKQTDTTVKTDDAPWTIGDDAASTVDGVVVGYRAGAAVDDFGILVGSGVNAEDFEDFALQTPIVEGAGAGQLNHIQSEDHVITWTVGTLTLKNDLVRYFNNNGGISVDVNEVALVDGSRWGDGMMDYFVMSRDHLASTVTVPDTGQLKVTYTISLTYPS